MREIERRAPELVTTAWWKEERGEKVFIDYNQMARDRTIASAYSIRPLPGAPLSTPMTWDELAGVTDPRDYKLFTVPDRVADGDPWAGIDDTAHSLEPLLELDFDLTTPDGTRLSYCLAAMALDEGVRREGPPLRLPASGERAQ